MKRAMLVLIIFVFIILSYKVGWGTRMNVTGEVIAIKEQLPFLVTPCQTKDEIDFYTARGTITLRIEKVLYAGREITLSTEKNIITLPVNHKAWVGYPYSQIKIGDIVSVDFFSLAWDENEVVRRGFRGDEIATIIKIIRTASEEQAKAQLPKAITLAKLGQIKEAIDIYRSIPEEVWIPDNIPLWNERSDLFQALKPYVQQHKTNAKSFETKGRYREALNEYAEALRAADDTEAEEIRKTVLEICRRNPSLSELPEDARRHVMRGDILVKEGNFEEAVKEYRKAIQKAPFIPKL